jgi:hypothetical protein
MSVPTATRLSTRSFFTESPSADTVRAWLARLPINLGPFAPAAFVPSEPLSPDEIHAVSRALACPDVFLIDSPDRISGETVIARIAELVADRVLVLSPDPAAADRLTERLAGSGVVRALADDENPIRPSPVVARLTSAALGPDRAERMRRAADEAFVVAQKQAPAAGRIAAINAEVAELMVLRERVETETRAGRDRTDLDGKESELAALRRRQADSNRARAGNGGGFLAWLFGRRRPAELDAEEIAKRVAIVAVELAALESEHEQAIRNELASRRAPLDARLAALAAERDRLVAAERELDAARQRVGELAAPDLTRRLLSEPRIVVGTPGSLEADPVFVDAAPFALIILDRAEELLEADFVRLCGLAARCLLVGDVQRRERPVLPDARGVNNGKATSENQGRTQRPTFVARLAPLLDREPWTREAGRLVCRLLHPVTAAGRQHLTREPLLDRPEIELRFSADGSGEPAVAEVAFPDGTSIADAKSFLFHQLGEVVFHPCGAVHWEETPGSILARWRASDPAARDATWVELEAGVCEQAVCTGWNAFTAAIEFNRSQGWDRERAEAWLAKHDRRENAGRYAVLSEPARRA